MGSERRADFGYIVSSLRSEATSSDVLDRLLTLTIETLACDRATATLTLQRPGEQTSLATDADVLVLADPRRLDLPGPSADVVAGQAPVLVADLRCDDRWRSWAAAAVRSGLRSMLCVPLTCSGARLGSVTAYDANVGHFTVPDVGTARFMAGVAASAVASARDHDDLWRVIDARHTLGYAQGIVMQRDGLDAARAIMVLQDRSDRLRLTLQVVAERLVRRRAAVD